ncbi:MAG: ribosome-associated translation inhibitor RaiA [Candidatus Phosphoribacter sp.]|nr:ribosome-associated translation inhibitor RaiA [Actinomycetales bacterium]
MDIVVTGRHIQVSDKFRARLDDKLAKVAQVAPKITRVDVVVTHERTSRNSEFVELTCRDRGSVVRAEAASDDKYIALDLAIEKLVERLRRANGRRRAAVRSAKPEAAPVPVQAGIPESEPTTEPSSAGSGPFGAVGDSPIEVREKVHPSEPMSLGEAVNRMELIGHDFYLFNDADTGRASVVYRRRGWSYGVIHLEPVTAQPGPTG